MTIEDAKIQSQFESKDNEERIKVQNQFLNYFTSLMRTASFQPLSKAGFDVCNALSFTSPLSGIPVEVDWSQLDTELLSNFFKQSFELDDFNSRCMVFWRGAYLETKEGTFALEKIDLHLRKLLNIFGLGTNHEREDILEKVEFNHKNTSCIHEQKVFQRNIFQSMNLWQKEKIKEPYFEEVVFLYRKKFGNASNNSINIQRFYNIPLKDLKIIFPYKKVGKNWADFISILMLLSGIITICFKLFSALEKSTYLDEAFMTILFLLLPFITQQFLKRFIVQRSAQRLHHQMVTETILTKNLNCNKSVLSYIRESSQNQTLKVIFFLLFLWQLKYFIGNSVLLFYFMEMEKRFDWISIRFSLRIFVEK